MLLYFLALFLTLLLCRFTESKLLINYMQKESYVSLCNISMQKNISDFIRALVFGFPLFIVSALRYNVGTDYQSYLYDIYSTSYNIDIDVEQLNAYNEKEVLFLPFTEFKVEKIYSENKYGKKIYIIELIELGNKNFVVYKHS